MPKEITSFLFAAALLLVLAPAATSAELGEDTGYACYGALDGPVKVVVSSVMAKIEKIDTYLPLEVAVGIDGAAAKVVFDSDSFALIDAQGKTIKPATPDEVAKNQGFWLETERLRMMRPIQVSGYFNGFRPVPSNFYHKDGGASGTTELDNRLMLQDILFFPVPASLDGVMTLVVQGEGMSEPAEVGFEVPQKHKKDK